MSNVYTSIDQLIGHTPLLELTHFEADEDLKARVLVKLEYFNPAGSVKDRVDIQCEISPVPFQDISKAAPGEPSAKIRERDRKSTRLNSSHRGESRMPSSA